LEELKCENSRLIQQELPRKKIHILNHKDEVANYEEKHSPENSNNSSMKFM
jgi:hypothetical protein